MNAASDQGFTLAEVMISIAITGVLASGVILLLDTSIDAHERGNELGTNIEGALQVASLFRADVARATSFDHAGTDSLELTLSADLRVRYTVRDFGSQRRVYRSIDDGSGFVESPLRPIATLTTDHGVTAELDFSDLGDGRLEAYLASGGQRYRILGRRWSDS